MKRHTKNGLVTAIVAFVVLTVESLFVQDFSLIKLIRLLFDSVWIGLLVGIVVYYMDKKD